MTKEHQDLVFDSSYDQLGYIKALGVELKDALNPQKGRLLYAFAFCMVWIFVFSLIFLVPFLPYVFLVKEISAAGVFIILFCSGTVATYLTSLYFVRDRILEMRAELFSQKNGFEYDKGSYKQESAGIVFNRGSNGLGWNIIKGRYSGNAFQIFNYSYELSGHVKDRQWGVVEVALAKKLPNVIFDSKANNLVQGTSNLHGGLKSGQKFQFEGDFNNYFDVYVPKNYGRDVLYFMTPELMEILVQKAAHVDIEFIDGKLLFYTKKLTYKSDEFKAIFSLLDAVVDELSENTKRYRDERVADAKSQVVSESGARLQRRITISVSTLILLVVVAYTALRQ